MYQVMKLKDYQLERQKFSFKILKFCTTSEKGSSKRDEEKRSLLSFALSEVCATNYF